MHSSPTDPSPPKRPVPVRPLSIRYMGFECTSAGRAYRLRVEGPGDPREFTLTIPNVAFEDRKARFQDAPDLCFARLQRELATNAELADGAAPRDHARRARRVPRRAAAPLARPQDAHAAYLALMPFSSFGLDPLLLRGIRELGFARPTPIQQQAIPPALLGKDVLGCAATGSGKTAAFGLPILHRLMGKPRRTTRALILTPTRELCAQIDAHIQELAVHTPVTSAAIFGGVGHGPAGARAARRRRHHRGDAGAAARPLPQALRRAQGPRDPGARRGRPHARHGLPARHQARAAAPAREAADAVLLRHHAGRRSSRSRASCCATP